MNKAYLYIGITVFGTFLSCKQAEVATTQKAPIDNKSVKIKTDAQAVQHDGKPEVFETEIESPRPAKTNTPK